MVQLHRERLGAGPRLLYCNGSGVTLESTWPMLTPLAAHFDLVAFDYRGLGASAPVTEPYSMADLAGDVAELLDALGWDRTALVGLSFGGMVAQEFAVTHPERVTRLALLATSPGGAFPSYPLETLVDLPDGERAERTLVLSDRRMSGWLADHPDEAAKANGFAPDSTQATPGALLQLRARSHHDVVDRLHRVNCPTFVASGRFDDIAPVVNGQAIADRVGGAEFRVYEGGHAFLVQDPAAWPDLVGFLGAGGQDAPRADKLGR
ncbi:MAG: alpha/beta fold hydrolase [Mycobacterium sp.]